MGLVVDASVCAKWLFDEDDRAEAMRLLVPGRRFRAPDLLPAEIGSLTWKKRSRGEVTLDQAEAALTAFRKAPVDLTPAPDLALSSLAIALALRHSFYDCLYLALAQREGVQVVTADRRLRGKVAGTAYAHLVVAPGDLP